MRGNSRCLLVFTNLLAHADSSGAVDIHPRSIADEVGLPLDEVRAALLELESIDPESRSHEQDGRRIIRLDGHRDWGWQIVNYVKYRQIKSEDDRREQNRQAQAKWRAKNKHGVMDVSSVSTRKPESAQAEAEANTEEEGINTKKTRAIAPPFGVSESLWADFKKLRSTKKAPITQTAIDGISREAGKACITLSEALAMCCARGWTGFKADWVANNAVSEKTHQPESFKERDARIGRERWEEMTGRTHPENMVATTRHGGMVVDIAPRTLEIQQ